MLDEKITDAEVEHAVFQTKDNKSPGLDGIPFEFYKVFWSKLKGPYLDAINECFEQGSLST
jgi:hypothetical protein